MKKFINKLSLRIASLSLLFFAHPVVAATAKKPAAPVDPLDTLKVSVKEPKTTDPAGIIKLVITWVLGFSAAVAVLFVIYAGLQMVTAAGNKERYEAAKKTLTYAVLGLIIIVLAYAIVQFVINVPTSVGLTS